MEVIGACEPFDLDDAADVGAVRRRSAVLAAAAGLDEVRAGEAALIATELASNVLRHAQRGGAVLGHARDGERRGVVIAVWDRGPGMDIAACLRDGMSTAGTRGAGLGAVARIAARFDGYARPGRGSVVIATVLGGDRAPPSRYAVGGICMPHPGLQVCGDAWDSHVDGSVVTIIACDGLGHGDGAAVAARAVTAAFRAAPAAPLAEILQRAGRAARGTRGAAATIARLDLERREVAVAGIGNVAAWIVDAAAKQVVTQHGTLGQSALTHIHEERLRLPPGALFVLCSDGIRSRWNLDDQPGLFGHDPTTIATVMWRDLARGRDDASVVVVREAAR